MKNRLILWLVLLAAGFLVGFVPQHLKMRRINQELAAARQQLDSCQASAALFQLRDTAAILYLEATRKNYGTAAEYSSRLFESAQRIAPRTSDPAVKAALDEVLSARDTITAELAKGDPAVVTDLQPIIMRLEEGTKP